MSARLTSWLSILLIVLAFVVGMIFSPQLPLQMVSHRNAAGIPDGYMSKVRGTILLPLIMLVIRLLLTYLPRLDPLKPGEGAYGKRYRGFILLMILFFTYLYGLTIRRNLGHSFQMGSALLPALALLFFYIGVMLRHTKKNRFVGIRTPRTLSSDSTWDKTHRLGGTLFQISGVLCLGGLLFPAVSIRFILVPVIGTALMSIIYSYMLFRKSASKGS